MTIYENSHTLFAIYFLEYSDDLKEMLFSSSLDDLEKVYKEEKCKAPDSLTSQFSNRLSRADAIHQNTTTQAVTTAMFPSLPAQDELIAIQKQSSGQGSGNTSTVPKKKKAPHCKKCKRPMLGHPRGKCPS